MLQYLPKQQQTERDQEIWSCEELCKKQDRSHEQHRQGKRREYVFWNDEDKNTGKDKWSAFDGKQDDRVDYQLDKSIIIIKEGKRKFLPASAKQIKNINSIITSSQYNRWI